MVAAQEGHTEVVSQLLEAGANTDLQSTEVHTNHHDACTVYNTAQREGIMHEHFEYVFSSCEWEVNMFAHHFLVNFDLIFSHNLVSFDCVSVSFNHNMLSGHIFHTFTDILSLGRMDVESVSLINDSINTMISSTIHSPNTPTCTCNVICVIHIYNMMVHFLCLYVTSLRHALHHTWISSVCISCQCHTTHVYHLTGGMVFTEVGCL